MSEVEVATDGGAKTVVKSHIGKAEQAAVNALSSFQTVEEAHRLESVETDRASPEEAALESAPHGWTEAIADLPKVYGLTVKEKEKIATKNKTYVPPPDSGLGNSLANGVVIGAVSAASKVIMRGLNRMYTYRLDVLCDAIERRPSGSGLLTVSNHNSVADDPIMLAAMLPPRIIFRPGLMRWGLCSVDICFQNPAIGRFMTLGKALPIMRSAGVSSPLVSKAAEKLVRGDWLHVYPEGRVVQQGMGYMKRGVGKMLAIAHEHSMSRSAGDLRGLRADGVAPAEAGLPVVLPMYHEGVENVMPQDVETHELISIVPRVGNKMYTIVGNPVDFRDIFERLMPACSRAGGTTSDAKECLAVYDAVADRLGMSVRLLRAELRLRVRAEHGEFLGDPYEIS